MLAPPSAGEGSRIMPQQYQLLLKWHLGLPILPSHWAGAGCPRCGAALDVFGDHAVSCQKGLSATRHHGVVNHFCQMLCAAKVPYERESACLGDARRPADVLLKAWDGRKDMAVDVTVVHALNPSGDLTVAGAQRVFQNAHAKKTKDYSGPCESAGIDFQPAVFDTWGGGHLGTPSFVKAVVKRAAAALVGRARVDAVTAMRRGVALAVMRGVAVQLEVLLTTAPPLWADDATHVLVGEVVDDAGNSWPGTSDPPRC